MQEDSNGTRKKVLVFLAGLVLFFIFIGIIATNPLNKGNKHQTSKEVSGVNISETKTSTHASPIPSITTSPDKNQQQVRVTRVIDGDTIELEGGRRLRYIGINTPETKDPRKVVECFGKEASQKNKELVEGKQVRLEKDVSETDKYGRLLRYVWVGDVFVNELLVKEGYAYASSYPPDVKYQETFRAAQKEAQEKNLGLWSACKSPTSTQEQSLDATQSSIQTSNATNSPNNQTYTCDCSKSCSELSTCDEAQYQLKTCGCTARDGDHDGIACDGAPLLCQ